MSINCFTCPYRRPLSSKVPSATACHYLIDTGMKRNCNPEQCKGWEEKSLEKIRP